MTKLQIKIAVVLIKHFSEKELDDIFDLSQDGFWVRILRETAVIEKLQKNIRS